MTNEPTFVARPPSNGFRVRMDGPVLRARLLDDADLGYAVLAVFVPVVEVGDDERPLRFVVDGEPCEQADAQQLKRNAMVVSLGEPEAYDSAAAERCGSYLVEATLPGHLADVTLLVLLVYHDRIPPSFADLLDEDLRRPWPEVARSVQAALGPSRRARSSGRPVSADDLRAALIAPPRRTTATTDVTFALASCLYPCDILDHMPQGRADIDGPADEALLRLGRIVDGSCPPGPSASVPELFVLAGDQVYVDATAGLFDPQSRDDRFRIPYENLYASRGAQAVYRRRDLELRMLIDDHEIDDDWDPGQDALSPAGSKLGALGIAAYRHFQRDLDLPPRRKRLWSRFEHRGLRFFLADTRTEREARTVRNLRSARIMSSRQMRALKAWLRRDAGGAKHRFVVSPSIFLPRRSAIVDDPGRALACDAWAGYPSSLHELLAFVCDARIEGVTFLSGDEHLSCDFTFAVRRVGVGVEARQAVTFRSVHSSPLYAPYPFANSRPEDLALVDDFTFEVAGTLYRCETLSGSFAAPGSGFALVTVSANGLAVRFDRRVAAVAELNPG